MDAPRLTVADLELTPPRVADAAAWADAQDDECARWFDWPGRPDEERCRDYLAGIVAGERPDAIVWAIRRREVLVGGAELARVDDGWNVSYFVHPNHRGAGVATAALRRVCAWAFEVLGASRVSTRVHVDNVASHVVLERAGFVHTGTAPNEDADHLDDLYELHRPSVSSTG